MDIKVEIRARVKGPVKELEGKRARDDSRSQGLHAAEGPDIREKTTKTFVYTEGGSHVAGDHIVRSAAYCCEEHQLLWREGCEQVIADFVERQNVDERERHN